jgi:hypothetical protein
MVKGKLKAMRAEDHATYTYETCRQDFKQYYSRQKTEISIQFHAPLALYPDERHIAEKGHSQYGLGENKNPRTSREQNPEHSAHKE